MKIVKNNQTISTLDDWLNLAGPKKGKDHWQDGRSAKECAICWLNAVPNGIPYEVSNLLASHPDFGNITFIQAEPEAKIPFDGLRGEVRNADIAITANDDQGPIALTVEAKADETFDELVPKVLAAAIERSLKNERSCGIKRIEQLVAALLGPQGKGEPSIQKIRYQLLTATAGTVSLASRIGAKRAVFIVEEFKTRKTSDKKHEANSQDLNAFVYRLSGGSVKDCPGGMLRGPFTIPGSPLFSTEINLYIGKVVHNLRMACKTP